MEPDKFIQKEYKWAERKIFSSIDVLSRSDVREALYIIESVCLDRYVTHF